MLADAMIYLVMQADGVTEDEFRALHLGMGNTRPTRGSGAFVAPPPQPQESVAPPATPGVEVARPRIGE
jgi:hypothetical protein